MKHLDGLRLIASAIPQEPLELNAGLLLVGCQAGAIEALCPRLRRDQRGQIRELARLQGDELIAGLGGLQDALGGLARGDKRIGLGSGCVERLHHAGLHAQRILVAGERVLPTDLRIANELLRGGRADPSNYVQNVLQAARRGSRSADR